MLEIEVHHKARKSRGKPKWPDRIGHKKGFTNLNIEQIVKKYKK